MSAQVKNKIDFRGDSLSLYLSIYLSIIYLSINLFSTNYVFVKKSAVWNNSLNFCIEIIEKTYIIFVQCDVQVPVYSGVAARTIL